MRLPSFGMALFLLLGAGQGAAFAEAGRFQFVHGEVFVTHPDGSRSAASKGDIVDEGDTITTGALAQAQLAMKDEGLIALRPDSRLHIETYRFSGKSDGSEQGVFALLKGGFRSITGFIGRINKDHYKVRTATATIGIRGTDHEPLYIPPPAPGETPLGPPGTYDKVNSGRTYMESAGRRVELGVNQVGFVAATGNAPPVRLPAIPDFLKATPGIQTGAKSGVQASGQTQSPAASTTNTSTNTSTSGTASTDGGTSGATDTGSTSTSTSTSTSSTGSTGTATSSPLIVNTVAAPATVLVSPSPSGAFNPANPTVGGGIIAPAGTAVAGGGMGSTGPNNGAGFIGDPSSNLIVTLDASGAPVTVIGNNFSYSRNGAPALMSGGITLSGETVRWGVYDGGVMTDEGVTSAKTVFFWMDSTSASTAASLLSAMPAPGAALTFAGAAGHTSPITENGSIGGTVTSSIVLKNLAGVPSVFSYALSVTDALSRTWSASLVAPQSLDSFRTGSVQNLTGTCAGCALTTLTGNAQGVVIGNPVPVGMISSYKMTAGTSAVVGAVVTR